MEKKRYGGITILIAAALFLGIFCFGSAEAAEKTTNIFYGDVNSDGAVDMKDILLIQKNMAELIEFTPDEKYCADVNGDGNVDLADILLIQKHIAELLDKFPADTVVKPTVPVNPTDAATVPTQAVKPTAAPTNPTQAVKPTVPSTQAPQNPTDKYEEYAKQVFDIVNNEREAAGLSKLVYRTDAQAAADIRAKEIVTSFSHTRPNGTSCFTALKETGVSYKMAGENIASGYRTPQEVMNGWMNSQGHRENILKENFTGISVGVYESGGRLYWVQMFVA